mmetsp:Transcript_288/g.720  ORF Transcript_288/g.720 Transcript_288/m.720 type:complete len:413 (-) Transcript_288:153-1391(-)
MDQFVQTSHQSYGSRIITSCKGMMAAPLFVIIGIWLMVWNEGNSITQHKALNEALARVHPNVPTDVIDPANNDNLIHFIGAASTKDLLQDSIFGVEPPVGTLKLQRKVETFQWIEHKHTETHKNNGGSTDTVTTYTYEKDWSEKLISSSNFGQPDEHQNPTGAKFQSQTLVANPIQVDAFQLSSPIVNKMSWYQPLSGTTISIDTISDESLRNEASVMGGDTFYFGATPAYPQVGDTRVSFVQVPSQTISVVAQQSSGGDLTAYMSPAGASVLLVESGPHSAAEMFHHAHQAVTVQTWIFRVLGWMLLFLAAKNLVAPLSVLADVLPFVGDLVEVGNDCLSFFVSAIASIVVIALAWLSYRPLVSLSMLVLVGGAIYLAHQRKASRSTDVGYAQASVLSFDNDGLELNKEIV